MTTIKAFFLHIRGILSNVLTRAGGTSSLAISPSTGCIYLCQQQEDRKRCEVHPKLTIRTLRMTLLMPSRCFIVFITFFFWYLQVIIFFYSSLNKAKGPYFVEITVIFEIIYFFSTIIKILN